MVGVGGALREVNTVKQVLKASKPSAILFELLFAIKYKLCYHYV